MKKLSSLLTVVILASMVLSTCVSADTISAGPDGVVWYDPVTYEAPLSDFPDSTSYTSGITFMNTANFPGNLTYVEDDVTPVGTGYLKHEYSADYNNGILAFLVGDKQSQGFAEVKDADSKVIGNSYMPGSIGKQKAELVFRLTSFGEISMSASSLSNVFDFRVWKSDKTGNNSGVMGVQVSQSGLDDLAWKATLTSSTDSTRGSVNTDEALHLNTWYRATIVTDFATSYQQGYIEKWDDSTKSWVILKSLFEISSNNTDRTLEGMNLFSVSSSARVRFSNKLVYDIAQARIVRDNIMVYQSNPADATTAADKIALKDKYGVYAKLDEDDNIVATTYVAGNAFGKDSAGNQTRWYTYSDGTYHPSALKPALIVAQYDENKVLIKAEANTVDLSTLKSGYRNSGTNFTNFTYDGNETEDGDKTSYLQKSLEYKELKVSTPKDAKTKTAKVFLFTGFDKIIPMSNTIDFEYKDK